MSVALNFGLCYEGLKQYPLAEQYYFQAVSLGEQTNSSFFKGFAWHQISQFYVATAQYKKAEAYLKRLQPTFAAVTKDRQR